MGVEDSVPIAYGSVAWWLGKKARPRFCAANIVYASAYWNYCLIVQPVLQEDYNTHRWTVYLRGPNNEDLSHIISKALHRAACCEISRLQLWMRVAHADTRRR